MDDDIDDECLVGGWAALGKPRRAELAYWRGLHFVAWPLAHTLGKNFLIIIRLIDECGVGIGIYSTKSTADMSPK